MVSSDDIILKEEDRTKLDGIVGKMHANKEADENIRFVVNDFKSKYGQKKKTDPYSYSFDSIPVGSGPELKPISTQEVTPTSLEVQKAEQKKAESLRQKKLSDKIVSDAHAIKTSVKDYMGTNLATKQAGEFLDQEEQKVFNAKTPEERSLAMASLTKSKVDHRIAVENLLTQGYKTESVTMGTGVGSEGQIPQTRKVPLTQDEKLKLKQELTDLDGYLKNTKFFKDQKLEQQALDLIPDAEKKVIEFPQQSKMVDFLNDNKNDIAEHYPELLPLLPEKPTAQDIFKAYYNVVYQDYKRSEGEQTSDFVDAAKAAIHTVTGTLFMGKDEQDHIELGRKLKALAPIALLNTYHDTEADKSMAGDFLKNVAREFYPDYKGTTKTEDARQILGALDHLDIPRDQLNKSVSNMVTKVSEPSTAEDIVNGTGAVLGSLPRMLLMSAVTEGAAGITGLNNLIEASAASTNLATKAGSFMMRAGKSSAVFGLTGDQNPIKDAIGFQAGIEGFEMAFGKYGKVVAPILKKIYGDAAGGEMRSIMEKTGKFIGAGAGITAGTEMSNYTSSLWNTMTSDANFKDELKSRGYLDKDGQWTISNSAKQILKEYTTNAMFGFLGLSAHDIDKKKQDFNKLADELENKGMDNGTVETLRGLAGEKTEGRESHPLEDVVRANKQILDFWMKGQRPTYKPDQVAQATTPRLPSSKDNIFLHLPEGKPGQPIEPAQPIPVWNRNNGMSSYIFPDKEGFYEVKKEFGYPEDMRFQILPDGGIKLDGKSYEEIPLPEQGGVMMKYKGKEKEPEIKVVPEKIPVAKEKPQKGVATTSEGTETPIVKKEKAKKNTGTIETDEGIVPIVKKEAVVQTTTQEFEQGQREVSMGVHDINTDVDMFQNRTKDFSQETVDSIKNDVKEGKFDVNKLDPIRIWKNPKDGKNYVISGHSRLEAFKQLNQEGMAGFENIPSIDMSYMTEEEAKNFATKESNTMGTKESPMERANVYRKMMDEKQSDASIVREAKSLEKMNWKYVYNLAHLDPKGKTLSDIGAFEKTTDEENKKKTERVGDWIGELKSRNPELSTEHENELHDYLWDNIDKHKSKDNFIEFANKRIESLKSSNNLNSTTPLNLERQVSKSDVERNYENKVNEARKSFDEARKAYDVKKDEFVAKGITPEQMTDALKPYKETFDSSSKELATLLRQRGMVKEAAKNQTSIWDQLDQKLESKIKEGEERIKKMKSDGNVYGSFIPMTPEAFEHIRNTAYGMARTLIKMGKSVDHILEQVGKFIESQIDKIREDVKRKESDLNRNKDNENKVNEIKKDINKSNEDIKSLQDIVHHATDGLSTLLKSEEMKLFPEGIRYDDDATKRITDEIKARIEGEDKKDFPVDKLKTFALDYFKTSLQDTKKISSEGASKIIDRINGADTHIKLAKAINSITTIMRKENMRELYDESVKSRSTFQNSKDKKKFASLYEDLNVLGKADINNMPPEFLFRYNEMRKQMEGTVNADQLSDIAAEARAFINARVSESGMKKRELNPEQRAEYQSVLKQKAETISTPSDFLSNQKESVSALKELVRNYPDKFTDLQLQQVDEIFDQLKNGWKSPEVENIVAHVNASVVMPEAVDRIKLDGNFEGKLRYYWEHPLHLAKGGVSDYEKLRNMTAAYKSAYFEYLKDGMRSVFYNNSYGKNATSTTRSTVEIDKFNDRYNEMGHELGKTDDERLRASVRLGFYAMTNENSPGALDRADRSMRNMIESGTVEKDHKNFFDACMDGYKSFVLNEDGKMATKEEMWNKLTDAEKKAYQQGRADLDGGLKEKNKYITTDVNGNHFTSIKDYAHLNLMGIHGGEIPNNESDVLLDLMERNAVDTKKYITMDTQSSHERNYPENGFYNPDFIGNMKKYNADVTYLYYKAPAIKEIMAFINHPDLKASLGDSRWKAFKKDMSESIILDKAQPERDSAYKIINTITKNVRAGVLMAPIARQVSEGISQIMVSANGAGLNRMFPAMNDIMNHGDKMREFAELSGMSVSAEYAKDIKWMDTKKRYSGLNTEWWHGTAAEPIARTSKALTDWSMKMNTAGWRNANKAGGFANLYRVLEDSGIEKPDWGAIPDVKEWYGSLSPDQRNKLKDAVMTANMNSARQQSPSSPADEANKFRMQNGETGMTKLGKSMLWFLSHYTRGMMARQINATVDLGKAVGQGDLAGVGNSTMTMATGVAQAMAYKILMVQIGGLIARGVYSLTDNKDKEEKSLMVNRANEMFTPHAMEKEAVGSLVDAYIGGYSIPLRYALGTIAEDINALVTEHTGQEPLHYNKERDAITYNSPIIHDWIDGKTHGRVISNALTDMFLKNVRNEGMRVDNLEKALRGENQSTWKKFDAGMNLMNTFLMVNPLQKEIDDILRQQTDKQIEEAKNPITQKEYEETKNYKETLKQVRREMKQQGIEEEPAP